METTTGTQRLQGYVRVARAPSLALPVTLVVLGSAAAVVSGGFDPVAAFLAFVGLLSLHISVNARNEYRDFQSGVDLETDPTPFSGGSKALPEGVIDPVAARRLALVTAAVGAVIGLYFLLDVGLLLLPVIVVGAVSVLFYTSHLTKIGLGEVFAGLGLGGLPVFGTAFVQVGAVSVPMVLVAIPSSLLTFDLLLLNEFPDVEADQHGGRRNLVHRLGRRWAAVLYSLAAVGVPVSIILSWAVGPLPLWALLGLVPSALLVRPISWALRSPNEPVPLVALRDNVVWILGTNFFLGVGMVLPVLL